MAEDAEKRFQRVMDKLYHFPKSKPPPPSGGWGTSTQHKGRRREVGSREEGETSTRQMKGAIMTRDGGAPPCRPWDRGDLMRRLATFKAMTWFGKPKAIDPVNCARRGWVNVEMDTLACEACGARLLFSTPSSWTLQQVEKAAAVFSLKLDNGHKLLCPWIDNICDEALAFFPPTPAPALIEGYRERSAALLQLSALPVISSSAIDYMRSPHLEGFLAESSSLTYQLDGGMKLTTSSGSMALDSLSVANTSSQYYQAHKIISLCGWELRLLPYVVDHEDHSSRSKAVDSSSDILSKKCGAVVYSSTTSRESDGEQSDQQSLSDQYDSASVVLDCKLCGACVGLWAFITVARPLGLFNLIESPEENGQNGSSTGSDGLAANEKPSSLNLTIAGGPPPTKQNFKPRISLPIVTRHLRAAFGSYGGIRNYVSSTLQGMDQLNIQSSLEYGEGSGKTSIPFSSETSGMLKRKRSENECSTTPEGSRFDGQPRLDGNVSLEVDTLSNEQQIGDLSSVHEREKGLMHEEGHEQISDEAKECLQNAAQDLVTEDAANRGSTDSELGHDISLQPGDGTSMTACGIVSEGGRVCENSSVVSIYGVNGFVGTDISSHDITSQVNHNSQNIASDAIPKSHIMSDAEVNDNVIGKGDTKGGEGGEAHAIQSHTDGSIDNQIIPVPNNTTLNSLDAGAVAVCTSRNDHRLSFQWDDTGKFDPIRRHRPFCPWIAPTDDKNIPGWKLTLRALVQDKCSSSTEVHSSIPDEVDDPIVSIRKLFTSPLSKRFRGPG